MPNILHRLTIDAPPERVHELAATRAGIQQWWTPNPVAGDDAVGGRFEVFFRNLEKPAAAFEVLERAPQRVVWRCVEGPEDWHDTRVVFVLDAREDGGTTLRFSHEGWRGENELMSGCSTNWGAYLVSLKSGAEGNGFNPYPGGEVSRWD